LKMPILPRPSRKKRSRSNADLEDSPSRKRIKHVTKRRMSHIYDVGEEEITQRSQELQKNVKEVFQEDIPEKDALILLRENDLDVQKAVSQYLSASQEDFDDDNEPAQDDDEDDSLEEKNPPKKKKRLIQRITQDDEEDAEAEIEKNEEQDEEKQPEMDDPVDPIRQIEEEIEPAEIPEILTGENEEVPDSENEAKERNLTHFLSAKFTQNALAVFKDCVTVVSKIQDEKDAIVMKIDSKEKKVKFWCRSSGGSNDVLEFVFENNANPRCFREFRYYCDADRTDETSTFDIAVPLKNLQTIARKINVKKHILTMDFHNDDNPGKSKVRFKFESLDDSTRFDFELKKIDVKQADPMLSQFHSVKESQDPYLASQQLDKSIHEDDALVTLWTSTKKFKEAHAMFTGVSDIISFQIHRMRPDTQDLSEQPEDEKFEVRLKSKGTDGDISSKTKLPLRGGPNLQSIHVKEGKEIKENINVDLPTDMVGKILNLRFIHNIVKIDFYEVDKVRFIFKFARSKCQGRLYYNVDPYPEYIDPDLEEIQKLAGVSEQLDEEENFIDGTEDSDPLKDSQLDDSMAIPKRKSPKRRKKKPRHSMSAQIDTALSDDDLNE